MKSLSPGSCSSSVPGGYPGTLTDIKHLVERGVAVRREHLAECRLSHASRRDALDEQAALYLPGGGGTGQLRD
jgi:hypothetical protein